ncbi:MAG: hypothetical protein RLZZ535_2993 [Cyanobacteriota bacterium]|jgi:asparagine synthase (glutamine-hydrolysing)
MFEFCLHQDDLEWSPPQDGLWKHNRSYIRPFSHRMVDVYYLREIGGKNRWMVIARERHEGASKVCKSSPIIKECSQEEFKRQSNILLTNHLDWMAIEVTPGHNKQVSLACGKHGTLPCYFLCKNNTLRGNYIPASLFPFIDKTNPLDFQRTCSFIKGTMPYGSKLILKEIDLLPAGSQITWYCNADSTSKVKVNYPKATELVSPKKIKSNVDPVKAFERIVKKVLGHRFGREPHGIIAELSGGLDSSIVAGVANQMMSSSLNTMGLLLPPNIGDHAYRRDIISATLGLNDTAISIEPHLLLSVDAPNFDKNRAAWEEPYMEAFNAMSEGAFKTDHDILLTGFGGDELFMLNTWELLLEKQTLVIEQAKKELFNYPNYLTDEARSAVKETIEKANYYPLATATSTLDALMVEAPMIAKAGFWPIHPFADPEVVNFCQQFPPEFRRDRFLQRKLLSSWGLPKSVWKPESAEDFSSFMSTSLRTNSIAIQKLFEESRLHEMGIINRNILIDDYRKYLHSNHVSDMSENEYGFYIVAMLEIMIQFITSKSVIQTSI